VNRRTATRVVDGRVQNKNNHAPTHSIWSDPARELVFQRQRPGPGHRHLLTKEELIEFIAIVPNWETLSTGLKAVLLAPGGGNCMGWCEDGVIAICAWERELWMEQDAEWVADHADLMDRLGIEREKLAWGVLCKYTERQAKAFQLLHIFLHELGHHHDRMTTKSKGSAANGEPFAEARAYEWERRVWDAYLRRFPLY